MTPETRLKELGLELPPPPKRLGLYAPVLVLGRTATLSGHGPLQADGSAVCGRLGEDLDEAAGYAAARQTGLVMLASLRDALGSLDRVAQLVKTTGFVQASPQFTAHPAVINGFSELMREVFGEPAGVGARSAVGVASLPAGWAVEIEAVFEIRDR